MSDFIGRNLRVGGRLLRIARGGLIPLVASGSREGISFAPEDPVEAEEVEFFAVALGQEAGPGVTVTWDFGDGITDSTSGWYVSRTYQSAGTYTVTLTITGGPIQGTWTTQIFVYDRPLLVSFTGTPLTGVVPLPVTFTSIIIDGGPPYTYVWSFGDGGTSTSANPVRTYTVAGTYSVTMTVTDASGTVKSQTRSNYIVATAAIEDLVCNFSGVPTSGIEGVVINFTSTVTGGVGPFTYAWNFGDSTTSTSANPSKTYNTSGNYTVSLVVTDSNAAPDTDTETKTNYVTITEPSAPSGDGVTYNVSSTAVLDFVLVGSDPGVHGLHVDHPTHPARFFGPVTITAVQAGNWSSASTWDLGRVPIAGDGVLIPASLPLRWATDTNTLMTTKLLASNEDGEIELDLSTSNNTAEIVFADVPIDTALDVFQWGGGFIGLGTVTLKGKPKVRYRRLAVEPAAGHTTLTFAAAVTGWRVGDKIIIPDTRFTDYSIRPDNPNGNHNYRNEIRTITAISGNSLVVTLDSALTWAHPGGYTAAGVLTFLCHVGNTSSNVIMRSASATATTRGHSASHGRAYIYMESIEIRNMGRTDNGTVSDFPRNSNGITPMNPLSRQIGRYAHHFHHLVGPLGLPAATPQFTIKDCAVWNENPVVGGAPTKWGITLHACNNGLCQGNFVSNFMGAGIMVEDSANLLSSSDNLIKDNFVHWTMGTGATPRDRGGLDVGFEGSSFWSHSPYDNWQGNIAACSRTAAHAWWFNTSANRVAAFKGANYDNVTIVNFTNVAFRYPVEGLEVYGTTSMVGFWIWRLGTTSGISVNSSIARTLVNDAHIWSVGNKGYYNYQTSNLTINDPVFLNPITTANGAATTAFFAGDYILGDYIINNPQIEGWTVCYNYGALGAQTINGGYMRNKYDIHRSVRYYQSPAQLDAVPCSLTTNGIVHGTSLGTGGFWVYQPEGVGNLQNVRAEDRLIMNDFNNTGINYEIYRNAQNSDAILLPNSYNGLLFIGSPDTGKTNAQNLIDNGICRCNHITPVGTVTHSNVHSGTVKAI